jgi:hypothetical protein
VASGERNAELAEQAEHAEKNVLSAIFAVSAFKLPLT